MKRRKAARPAAERPLPAAAPRPAGAEPPRLPHRPRVAVVFADGVPVPDADGAESALRHALPGDWGAIAAEFPDVRLTRMFRALTPERMQALVRRAEATDRKYRAPDFSRRFFADGPASTDFAKLAESLAALRIVERAYVIGAATSPTLSAPPDPLRSQQGYLTRATQGVDGDHALGTLNAQGQGVRLIDLEKAWILATGTDGVVRLAHDDLRNAPLMTPAPLHGVMDEVGLLDDLGNPVENPPPPEHGVRSVGVVCAQHNAVGIVGIAHGVAALGLSSYRNPTEDGLGLLDDFPSAIADAAERLSPGDVLLLEAQIPHPDTVAEPFLQVPVESIREYFDAVRLATACGVVVVEAGGNGSERGRGTTMALSLNDFVDPTVVPGERAFDTSVRDSLAILVSAAMAGTSPTPRRRLRNAPYGDRIDCFAWGAGIKTCGGDATNPYPDVFGQTSGASAIVAAAALAVQSRAKSRFGVTLQPQEMRTLLSQNGTANDPDPRDSATQSLIGRMPDLGAILDGALAAMFPAAASFYLRDFVGDAGVPHTAARIWKSPDIILRSTAVANPQTAFGEGSGTEDDDELSTHAVPGRTNFVYVRARNRGLTAAANLVTDVYWSEPATLMSPQVWRGNKVGTATIADLPTGDVLRVSGEIAWPAASLPPTGHNCFVAMAGIGRAPPPPDDFASMDGFVRFVQSNAEVAWRNFWVDPMPPGPGPIFLSLTFLVPGAPNHDAEMALEFDPSLPPAATLTVETQADLASRFENLVPFVQDAPDGVVVATLSPTHATALAPWTFPAGSVRRMTLRVTLPPSPAGSDGEVRVRQTWHGKTLGGLTWRLAAARPHRPWD